MGMDAVMAEILKAKLDDYEDWAHPVDREQTIPRIFNLLRNGNLSEALELYEELLLPPPSTNEPVV